MNIQGVISLIGAALVILLVVLIFIVIPILVFIAKHSDGETQKCKKCKGEMIAVKSYEYLIPARFDEEHEESVDYYIQNVKPIKDSSEIPAGNRACYIHLFQCQGCGHKNVSVVDFLKVRDQEILKGGDIYPYEDFKYFLENYAGTGV